MRELEIRTLRKAIDELRLTPGRRVLDAGCGDGFATLRLAEAFPNLHFTGVDYAPAMIETASQRLREAPDVAKRTRFAVGDVTSLDSIELERPFDLAITCRCLINLPDAATQRRAFEQIAKCLRPGATFLAIENFHEGQDGLNDARATVDLPAIPLRWHNRYFTEPEFHDMSCAHFSIERFSEFANAYYFATRVIYSKMCQLRGEEPDYDHDIHRLAVDLPALPAGRFSPIRLAVLKRL